MLKWLISGYLLVVLMLAGVLVASRCDAAAAYCPAFTCYSSAACGPGCLCITPPGRYGGHCYGVD